MVSHLHQGWVIGGNSFPILVWLLHLSAIFATGQKWGSPEHVLAPPSSPFESKVRDSSFAWEVEKALSKIDQILDKIGAQEQQEAREAGAASSVEGEQLRYPDLSGTGEEFENEGLAAIAEAEAPGEPEEQVEEGEEEEEEEQD